MSECKKNSNGQVFTTPFSKDYWKAAAAEFHNTRTLVFAAIMIALRVVFKTIKIPLGPFLDINTAFIINAIGAMSFGPVVAIAAAAITDTLGCLLFPSGPYFFPFIFIEIAGSLIFALFLYRTEITVTRIAIARFCIDFLVNVVLQTPIMVIYYQLVLGGKTYAWIDLPRIVKNIALFPFETVVLVVVLRYVIPPLKKLGYVKSTAGELKLNKRIVAALVCLVLLSAMLVAGYSIYAYNTTSLSASYSVKERFENNEWMNRVYLDKHPEIDESETITIIESAYPRFGSDEVTYTVAVYKADTEMISSRSENSDMTTVRGYSKSKAAKDEALVRIDSATIIVSRKTGAVISFEEASR